MTMKRLLTLVAALAVSSLTSYQAGAQQLQSHLYDITKSGKMKVCIWPNYYAISLRNPDTGKFEGIDIDLSKSSQRTSA
jgi:ABC-type amino acid transport substrate-binding protein